MICHTQQLWLSNNKIGDAGLTALAKAVESGALALLKELELGGNQIGDDGLKMLLTQSQQEPPDDVPGAEELPEEKVDAWLEDLVRAADALAQELERRLSRAAPAVDAASLRNWSDGPFSASPT